MVQENINHEKVEWKLEGKDKEEHATAEQLNSSWQTSFV